MAFVKLSGSPRGEIVDAELVLCSHDGSCSLSLQRYLRHNQETYTAATGNRRRHKQEIQQQKPVIGDITTRSHTAAIGNRRRHKQEIQQQKPVMGDTTTRRQNRQKPVIGDTATTRHIWQQPETGDITIRRQPNSVHT
ncbi:hypothetical protein J6590_086538, partial [Homalodisca vitripennis]